MRRLTALFTYTEDAPSRRFIETLAASPVVARIIAVAHTGASLSELSSAARNKTRLIDSAPGLAQILDSVETDSMLLAQPGEHIQIGERALERLLAVAEDTGAGLVYSDFKDEVEGEMRDHPLIDYQPGSLRDSFDFGPLILFSKRACDLALSNHAGLGDRSFRASLVELRLKLSIDSEILRLPEPLYVRAPLDLRATGERQFDYVDPRRRDYQREMEEIATSHLKRIGAYLAPEFERPEAGEQSFRVRASVVIPVRNRERTIEEAALSALSQQTSFDFNVLVVDNHSTDRTTEIIARLARKHDNLIHIRPERKDLGIGGCWNRAVYSVDCGLYAVQLDSDDLYADERVLERIVTKFDEGPFAMVIGSYTIVNFELQEIPPGLIDHREWTRENGRNNALRINGLGAPRAFYVPALRQVGFPNTSYGEDYAVALNLSRHFEIGRIYESIYFARRWEGNSDAALALATSNRYDAYKDYLRTVEILARKRINEQ